MLFPEPDTCGFCLPSKAADELSYPSIVLGSVENMLRIGESEGEVSKLTSVDAHLHPLDGSVERVRYWIDNALVGDCPDYDVVAAAGVDDFAILRDVRGSIDISSTTNPMKPDDRVLRCPTMAPIPLVDVGQERVSTPILQC